MAWSNPCIEIFFHAYYGRMPNNTDAKQCISAFSTDFQKATKKEYSKNDKDNLEVVLQIIRFIYDNIMYAELNTKSDYCQKCGYDGEILIDDNLEWFR